MNGLKVLLLTLCGLNAAGFVVAAPLTDQLPIDLYLVVDKSGSLERPQFRQELDFARDLAFGLGNLTSFYSNETNGLRVMLVTFACARTKTRIPLTGDPALINRKIDAIKKNIHTGGETCVNEALKEVNSYANMEETIYGTERAKALVFVTDGKIDDFTQSNSQIKKFRRNGEARVFSVGVGDTVDHKQLLKLTSNSEQVFQLESTNTLQNILGTLTSFLLEGFSYQMVRSSNKVPVNRGKSCDGIALEFILFGLSMSAFSPEDDLECDFKLGNKVETTKATFVDVALWSCPFPAHQGSYKNAELILYSNGGGRKKVNSGSFDISRTQCVDISPIRSADCLGQSVTMEFVGGAVDNYMPLVEAGDGKLMCKLSSSLYAESFETEASIMDDKTGVSCSAKKIAYSSFSAWNYLEFDSAFDQKDVYQPYIYDSASLSYSSNAAAEVPIVTNELVYTPDFIGGKCTEVVHSSKEMCWGESSVVLFSGLNLEWINALPQSAGTFECIFANEWTQSLSPAVQSENEFSCSVPDAYLVPADGPFTVGLIFSESGNNKGLLLSTKTDIIPNVRFCGEIVPVEKSGCISDAHTVGFKVNNSEAVAQLLQPDQNSVECVYSNKKSPIPRTSRPERVEQSSEFLCKLDPNFEDMDQTFNQVDLQAYGVSLITAPIEKVKNTRSCVLYSVRASPNLPYRNIGSTGSFDMSSCWGFEASNFATMKVTGEAVDSLLKTVNSLKGSLYCEYSVPDDFAPNEEMVFDATPVEDGFVCSLPGKIFSYASGSTTAKVTLVFVGKNSESKNTVGSSDFSVEVKTGTECFNTEIINLNDETATSFCFGSSLAVVLSGNSASKLSRFDTFCSYEGSTAVAVESFETNKFLCRLPASASTNLGVEAPELFLSRLSSLSNPFVIPLPGLKIDTDCLNISSEVLASDGTTVMNPAELCAGDELTVTIMSDSVVREKVDDVSCDFMRENGKFIKVLAQRLDSGFIQCTMPQWDPYSSQGRKHFFTSMYITIREKASIPVPIPTSRVCLGGISHGVDMSMKPISSGRRLQTAEADDCWPSCCKRASIDLQLSGNTVRLLHKNRKQLRCAFTTTQGSVDFTSVSFPEVDQLACESLPGWKLGQNSGNYTKMVLQILDSSLSEIEAELYQYNYEPSSARYDCINVAASESYCVNEMVAFNINGLTIDALVQDEDVQIDDAVRVELSDNGAPVSNIQTKLSDNAIDVLWDKFSDESLFSGLRLDLFLENVAWVSKTLPEISVVASESCSTGSNNAHCNSEGDFVAYVEVIESLVENTESREYECTYLGEDSELVFVVESSILNGNRLINCSFVGSGLYDSYEVSREGILLYNGDLVVDDSNCDQGLPEWAVYLLISVGGLLGIFLLLLACQVCIRRKRDASKIPVNPNVPEDSSMKIFKIGQLVEAQYQHEIDPENCDWFKGRIVRINGDRFAIKYLHEALGSEDNVAISSIRTPLSDFQVGQTVEGQRYPDSEWSTCTIASLSKNDTYFVSFQGYENDDVNIPGSRLRKISLRFNVGQIVSVFLPQSPETEERGIITSRNEEIAAYSVRFDDVRLGSVPNISHQYVHAFSLDQNEFVQVQDPADSTSWNRAQITVVHGNETYDIKYTNSGLGEEAQVPTSRIRRPVFSEGDRVMANLDETWLKGVVKKVLTDKVHYEVRIATTAETHTVAAQYIQLAKDEFMNELQRVVPTRTKNFVDIPEGPGKKPKNQRFKKRKPLSYVELPNNQFDITVDTTDGLGVHLGWTEDQKVIVAGFRDLENGDWGPLEASGLVMLKDQVIKINDVDVTATGMAEISETILSSKDHIKIRFGREAITSTQVDLEMEHV